ncbi:unnamed protein product [Effrenium voratum]|uniref:Choline transporter-like protein n=1 Tax=Effrenium voratum TaxID=2562239 RepID=A0AA36N5T9_9DINO|nr:unnamed protein product [Effrenium voratum]
MLQAAWEAFDWRLLCLGEVDDDDDDEEVVRAQAQQAARPERAARRGGRAAVAAVNLPPSVARAGPNAARVAGPNATRVFGGSAAGSDSDADSVESRVRSRSFHIENLRRLTIDRSGDGWNEEDWLKDPGDVERSCTDVSWVGFCGTCLLVLAAIGFAGMTERAVDLLATRDSSGHTCGEGNLTDKPYAFICRVHGELELDDIECRESCPSNSSSSYPCWDNATQSYILAQDYETSIAFPHVFGWCKPSDLELHQVLGKFTLRLSLAEEWNTLNIGLILITLWRLLVPFLIAGLLGVALSLIYVSVLKAGSVMKLCMSAKLFTLQDHAECLSRVGIRVIVLVPWGWAVYLWFGHRHAALLPCLGLIIAGIFLAMLAGTHSYDLAKAAACIQMSCTCVMEMPMLHFGPCLVLLFRGCSSCAMLFFLATSRIGVYYNAGTHSMGMHCEGKDDCPANLGFFIFWVGMFVWVENLFTACWEFAVAYLTAAWYTAGGLHGASHKEKLNQCCRQCSMWGVLLRYHLGTMAKAAIYIGTLRPFRFALGSITAAARIETNCVGKVIYCCCSCLVFVYERYFEIFSANAYIEVALTGASLDKAASLAQEVSKRQKGTASSLNGTTFIFQLVGLTLIWWSGYFVTWAVVRGYCPGLHDYGDPNSLHYIGNYWFWSNLGGIIAFIAAFPAMMVFDVASDTILYCAMLDIIQKEAQGTAEYYNKMPTGVREFIELVTGFSSGWSSGDSSASFSSRGSSVA